MADLLCCEFSCDCHAVPDPVLMEDRVLDNLLQREEKYQFNIAAFTALQKDLSYEMRGIVAQWMLEVCEEQQCQDDIFPLAINYMDRFLAVCEIKRTHLQLLGSVCLLLSSKLRENKPLSAETLVHYTDYSITKEQLWSWEILVLSKLKWDISSLTPNDFVPHLLPRILVDAKTCKDPTLLRHIHTLIAYCVKDHTFLIYTPSIIAAACIAAALQAFDWFKQHDLTVTQLFQKIHQTTKTEKEFLHSCLDQIEAMVRRTMLANSDTSSSVTPDPGEYYDKLGDHCNPVTPTDVRDVRFE